jgi:hypothetical protein
MRAEPSRTRHQLPTKIPVRAPLPVGAGTQNGLVEILLFSLACGVAAARVKTPAKREIDMEPLVQRLNGSTIATLTPRQGDLLATTSDDSHGLSSRRGLSVRILR